MRIVGCQKNEYDAVTRYADSNLTCTPFAQLVFDICKSETARVTRPVLPDPCYQNRVTIIEVSGNTARRRKVVAYSATV